MQFKRSPRQRWLYGIQGYAYGELLLRLGRSEEVRQRAQWCIETQRASDSLLDSALDNLLLGLATLGIGRTPNHRHLESAGRSIDIALSSLREASIQEFIARGLLARAALHRHASDYPAACRDLAEAHRIATRGGMRLHLADHHLESARLHLAIGDRDAAHAAYTTARAEVAAMGYHRRDPELAELAAVLDDPASEPPPG